MTRRKSIAAIATIFLIVGVGCGCSYWYATGHGFAGAVEEELSKATAGRCTIAEAQYSYLRGEGSICQLEVDNLPGYKGELVRIPMIAFKVGQVSESEFVFASLVVEDPWVNYEERGDGSNFGMAINHISAFLDQQGGGRRIRFSELTVRGLHGVARFDGASGSVPFTLPDITFTELSGSGHEISAEVEKTVMAELDDVLGGGQGLWAESTTELVDTVESLRSVGSSFFLELRSLFWVDGSKDQ